MIDHDAERLAQRLAEPLRLPIDADLCEAGLVEAVLMLGPSVIYDLLVSPQRVYETRLVLQQVTCGCALCPHFNILPTHAYDCDEWSLRANGQVVWSPGV